jgi:hypothetical protein
MSRKHRQERTEEPPRHLEIPPDATVFHAGGQPYYLYLGIKEMVALQREWGYYPKPGEDDAELQKRRDEFAKRFNFTSVLEDKVTILRFAFQRCALAMGIEEEITDDWMMALLDRIDAQKDGNAGLSRFMRVEMLFVRFTSDCYGLSKKKEPGEGKSVPKEQSAEGLTPSVS